MENTNQDNKTEVKNPNIKLGELSIGEIRCEVNFNSPIVSAIDTMKVNAAREINALETMKQSAKSHPELAGEIMRCISVAQTHIEEGLASSLKALRMIDGRVKALEIKENANY